MGNIPAVVLAAGEGSRLRPLTYNRPKPMLPAATKPILERVLDQLVDAGVTDVTLVVGHQRERVQSHFGPTYRNLPLSYVTQETQLGTGHALLAVADAVEGPLLVINGDQIVDSQIVHDVRTAHGNGDADVTLGLLRRTDVSSYGGVLLEDDRVVELVERPQDDRNYRFNAGVYALEPAIFDAIRSTEPRAGEHSLIDAIAHLVETDAVVRGIVSEGLWVDATYPWDLLHVATRLFDTDTVETERGIDTAASVHESATIRSPVVVRENCEIGPGAVVGPYAALGENVSIDANAVVERSVLDTDTRVRSNATVVECVTGQGVEIGTGTIVPGGPGDVRIGDRVFENAALGTLLADRVRDGGGVTYAPGTIVGPDLEIHSGSTIEGTLMDVTEVRA